MAGGGALAFAEELEELPRAALLALAANTPRALVEQLVGCAAADLVRERVVRGSSESKGGVEALAAEWRALGRDARSLQSVYGVVSALLVRFARENPRGSAAQRCVAGLWERQQTLERCSLDVVRDPNDGIALLSLLDDDNSQALTDLGLEDADFVAFLVPLLVAAVPPIQSVLAHSSFDFANVVDATWRLDYVLRSSSAGSIREPLYFVQLKLQTPAGRIERTEFTCSVDELRDLVYRLEEAVNEVEKLASGGFADGVSTDR